MTYYQVLEEIGVDRIDTLIISFPEKIFNQENLPVELVIPIWSVVQKHVESKQILAAGLSDFNAKYLEQFLNAIGDRNVSLSLILSLHTNSTLITTVNALCRKIQTWIKLTSRRVVKCPKISSNVQKSTIFSWLLISTQEVTNISNNQAIILIIQSSKN